MPLCTARTLCCPAPPSSHNHRPTRPPPAMTPWLELYVALRRTQAEPNKHIVEEPEDGAPITAAVLFAEDGPAATVVTLRVAYLLPGAAGRGGAVAHVGGGGVLCPPCGSAAAAGCMPHAGLRRHPRPPASRPSPSPAVVLHEFAGQLAVYGDVDRKLQASMQRMKEWVEGADAAAEAAGSAERMAAIRAGERAGGG